MHGTRLRSTSAAASPATALSTRQRRSATTTAASAVCVSPSRRSPAAAVAATMTTTARTPAHSLSPVAPSRSVSQGALLTSPARGHLSTSPSTLRGGHRVGVNTNSATAGPAAGSVAPSIEEVGTMPSTVSGSKDTGVSLSSFPHNGDRFEANTYETTFCFRGTYQHVALAEATATLWCANDRSGAIDLYSCVTGQFTASLQTLSEEVSARKAELSELPLNTVASTAAATGKAPADSTGVGSETGSSVVTPRRRGLVPLAAGGAAASPAMRQRHSSWVRIPDKDVKPTCLRATSAHIWVGYSDGTVAVYNALLLTLLTMGQFHSSPVVVMAVLRSGQVVSGSADGLLVLWDTKFTGFEALTRVTVLLEAVRAGTGQLCAMTASTAHATRVFCGFESGAVNSVFVANRPQGQTPAHLLKAHTSKVNDMAVVKELLFTAAEDNSVCVWYCGNALTTLNESVNLISSNAHGLVSAPTPLDAQGIRSLQTATKLLKRIVVKPCVRALLSEEQTHSVWVAYADGLLERWSANPDDDFGVEEIVNNALISKPVEGRSTVNANGLSSAAAEGSSEMSVKALLSLSAVQTMQWLALSSNGVNKVWYGHKNTLEMQLAKSLIVLHDVVARDAEDAAAWREKMNALKQKEMERRERYICILEQLNEQRVLQRHYARWRRCVLFYGVQKKSTAALAETLEMKAQVQLVRRYFGKWAAFYDGQQRHMRGYVLSMALSRATERQQLHKCFLAWQAFLVKQRVRGTAQASAAVMAKMLHTALLSSFFHRWRAAVLRSAQRKNGISEEHLALLAHKAQRQVQQRVLRQWIAHYEAEHQKRRVAQVGNGNDNTGEKKVVESQAGISALSRFAAHYARLQQQRQARSALQIWRRWTAKKKHYASLAAVAALREQQLLYEMRQKFFLRWRQQVHARHTQENSEQLKALEMQLRRAEAEHSDIFEKLQLQKQLEQLASRQAAEELQLAHTQNQLAELEQSCAQLREQQQQERQRNPTSVTDILAPLQQQQRQQSATMTRDGSDVGSSSTSQEGPLSLSDAASSRQSPALGRPVMDAGLNRINGTSVTFATRRGHMSANAVFYRSLVDQQRLSPIVLAHMPMEEAVHHVMGQLKGNVLNLYTDLALFRQVKDRRRAGTSAIGILLEAFGEVKRVIVSTVRGSPATAASAAAHSGAKATRWPLSMEALDCIPVHQCSNVLSAIKTIVVAYDLLQPEDVPSVQSTCEEVVANADWVFLIARACYLRRKPLPPTNNRQILRSSSDF